MALQRAFRLRKGNDFQRVRQQGRKTTSRLLSLAWAPNNTNSLRIGFVVSKRISKHAVTRNYIKRLVSEAIRPLLADLSPGLDIVISVKSQIILQDKETRKQIIVVTFPGLVQEITTLLHRARLLGSTTTQETNS